MKQYIADQLNCRLLARQTRSKVDQSTNLSFCWSTIGLLGNCGSCGRGLTLGSVVFFSLQFSGFMININNMKAIVLLLCLTGIVLGNDCFVGEYWSASGKCEQCDISCSTCSSAEGCSTCYDQMFLSAVGNQIRCKLCYEVNVNCQICSSAQKCKTCSNGFFLNENSTCSACSEYTPHCVYCQQNQTYVKCITCQYPRRVSNGICLNANETLASATAAATAAANALNVAPTSTVLSGTPSSSSLSNNGSAQQKATTQAPPSGAAASGNGGQVSLCNLDQVEISGVCVLAIPFCLQYNLTSLKCSQCSGDCLLSDQSYCIPAIIMATQGQAPQQAQAQPSNISNKTDIKKTAADCVGNQYFWYDQCVTIGTECINRTANNKCEGCIRGFSLKNGYCMQIPPNTTAAASSPTITAAARTTTGGNVQQGSSQGGQLQSVAPVGGSRCNFPCLSCSPSSPDECLTCVSGYTTVDAFPGRCFSLN